MNAMVRPAVVLLVVTLLASLSLGVVYEVTKEPIALQKAKVEAGAVAELLPGTEETESLEVSQADSSITKVITCFKGGEVTGYAVLASPKGYGGAIDLMVAFNMEGVIEGVKITAHAETPGLGSNAALPSFTGQYNGKTGPLRVVKADTGAPDEIDAITSATITSNAVTQGVNDASAYFNANLRTGG